MAKRPAPSSSNPTKKRRLTQSNGRRKNKQGGKPAVKESIAVPTKDDEDIELSDQDHTFLEEYGDALSFLRHLDRKGIERSKPTIEKIHRLNKPTPKPLTYDDLPFTNSSSAESRDFEPELLGVTKKYQASDSEDEDLERHYEHKSRILGHSLGRLVVERLPIKLADGRLIQTGVKDLPRAYDIEEHETEPSEPSEAEQDGRSLKAEDRFTGTRFGRPAVFDVVSQGSRKRRIEGAKDQIASICQEIVANPENSLGLLKRLHAFSQKDIHSPQNSETILNDAIIRKLAVLSQLAVFKDIIPGYRIRELSEKEAAEKVSQVVAHLREWEQGLVRVYQNYLQCLEGEVKARSELADTALRCMCTLLTDVTHFNFRVNLMTCVVAHLSRRSWTKTSDMCLDTLNSVFRADTTGVPSLEIVRILNRMIRERRFQIHANVLSCLLNLRLKSELSIRASETKADRGDSARASAKGRGKGKVADKTHLSKKSRKALKERKEIEKEIREAEAIIDKEERAVTQTETLKLVFTLYFRILKDPSSTPLLPAALHGISKFAHLVNIDFFKDLMTVLKKIISPDEETSSEVTATDQLHIPLLCIVTAFELLSGQGEALNVDLSGFIADLYALILPLSLIPHTVLPRPFDYRHSRQGLNVVDLLFDALDIVFSPRTSGATAPPWRSAAFSKRLLTASLNWSPASALRTLRFVGDLIAKDPKLEALLSTEDRVQDGVYQAEIDDPQLCHPFGTCFWELQALQNHWDDRVREEAYKLSQFTRS